MMNAVQTRTMMLGTLVLVMLAAGCASSGGAGPSTGGATTNADQVMKSLAGEWKLASLNGRDVSALTGMNGQRPSIHIDAEGRIAGSGGVNRIGGMLDLKALARGEFKTGPMFSTKMAGPQEAMRLEEEFTRALSDSNRFTCADGKLVLTGDGTRVEFVR